MHTTTIVGRVGADPKPLGQNGCYFSIATERYNSSTQQRDTTWSRLKAFGKTAETAGKYVTKGRLIAVICHYEVNDYESNDGTDRQDHSFVIDNLELLPDGKGQQPAAAGGFGHNTGPQDSNTGDGDNKPLW
jgi:single-strand DNA-binding protein